MISTPGLSLDGNNNGETSSSRDGVMGMLFPLISVFSGIDETDVSSGIIYKRMLGSQEGCPLGHRSSIVWVGEGGFLCSRTFSN